MLDQFVDAITLALPGVITWAAAHAGLRRFGVPAATRGLWIGTGVGALTAGTLSVLRRTTALINRELISLGLLPALLVGCVLFLVWLWRGRHPGRHERWLVGLGAGFGGLLALVSLPDLMLLTVGFVTPGGSVFSSELVLNLAGYLLGLAVVVTAIWAGLRAGRGATPRAARIAITAVVSIAMLGHLTTIVQILLARRLIGFPSVLFQAVVWLLNHEDWLTYGMVLAGLIPIVSAWRRHRATTGEPANPAERRIHTAAGISRRRFITIAGVGVGVAVAGMTVGRGIADAEPTLSPPEPLELDGEVAWVPLERIDDGHLHRFAYTAAEDVEVRFIAIRKNAKAFGVGLDACEICGPTGYFERNGQVICKLCDVAMNINTIGFKGGCNPIPLEYQISDGRLVVTRATLESHAGVFA